MDEVLCDFRKAAIELMPPYSSLDLAAHWVQWNEGDGTITAEEFWKHILPHGSKFWENISPLPWMKELIDLVNSVTEDWHLISSPPPCPEGYRGKIRWIKNNLGESFDRICLTPHKHLFAQDGVILIDDRQKNCDDFTKAGGKAILFPSIHNRMSRYAHSPMTYVKSHYLLRRN